MEIPAESVALTLLRPQLRAEESVRKTVTEPCETQVRSPTSNRPVNHAGRLLGMNEVATAGVSSAGKPAGKESGQLALEPSCLAHKKNPQTGH